MFVDHNRLSMNMGNGRLSSYVDVMRRATVSEIRIGHWTKLGSTIRDARRALSLAQSKLAERAGVSRSWLPKLESSHRGAEFEQILRVVSALGLSLNICDERAESATTKTTQRTAVNPERGPLAISAAAAERFLERHRSASNNRRSTWDDAELKGKRAHNG